MGFGRMMRDYLMNNAGCFDLAVTAHYFLSFSLAGWMTEWKGEGRFHFSRPVAPGLLYRPTERFLARLAVRNKRKVLLDVGCSCVTMATGIVVGADRFLQLLSQVVLSRRGSSRMVPVSFPFPALHSPQGTLSFPIASSDEPFSRAAEIRSNPIPNEIAPSSSTNHP